MLCSYFLLPINHIRPGCDFLLDLLFPLVCLSCGKDNHHLCDECFDKIKINQNFVCPLCQYPNKTGARCQSCQTKNELDGLWISADYHDKRLSMLIKKLKYSFNINLAPALGKLLCKTIKQNNLDQLVPDFHDCQVFPVPLHKSRLRLRGFNQSHLLADNFSRSFHLTLNGKQLVRGKKTSAQAKLNKEERLKNVRDAFAWQGDDLHNAKVILIDDVVSTSATLNNCAKVLKQHGAKEVWGLVLAKN